MTLKRIWMALMLLALCSWAPLPAQVIGFGCPGDDGFDVGCCLPPQPNLPSFPPFTESGTYGCLLDCSLEAQFNESVMLSAPNFVTCDLAIIQVTVTGATATAPSFSGFVLAKYERTWMEVLSTGAMRQVWRFLVNGDLNYTLSSIGSGAPCPVPPCAVPPASLPVHFTGHIDYALDCSLPGVTGNSWHIALNLNHVTGCLNHASFSARPLVGPPAHTNRTYCLVAPANFVFGPSTVPSGTPLIGESVRSALFNSSTGLYQCYGEAHVATFGTVQDNFQYCYGCGPVIGAGPAIWHDQEIHGSVSCGPLTVLIPFDTVPVPGIFPTGMVSMEIGSYVGINPDAFPTGRSISLNYGVMHYVDNCLPNDFPFFVFTGVGHTGGSPAMLFGSNPAAAPVTKFVDLQSMELLSPTGTFGPGIGALFLPRKVWSLNPQ